MEQKEKAAGVPVWFDVLAHTITVDGDWPHCVECGEPGSHLEHQPEELAATSAPAGRVGGAR